VSAPKHETYMTDAHGALAFCPGCGHHVIVKALNKALVKLQLDPTKVVLVTDIGCIGLSDKYFTTSAFHGLHGRSITYACGLKLARPELHVIAMKGDGGCGIGGTHLLNVARRNIGITLIVANNFNYGMTGGQHSVTTPTDGKTATTPWGNVEAPMDLCATAVAAGAAWVRRATAFDKDLGDVIATAIEQPGFAMLDIWELCTAYYTARNAMKKKELFELLERYDLTAGQQVDKPRLEYSERYRQGYEARQGYVRKARRIEPCFGSGLDRQIGILIAGSAGQKIKSTATLFAEGAMFAGLSATQKDDYRVHRHRGARVCRAPFGGRLGPHPGQAGQAAGVHRDLCGPVPRAAAHGRPGASAAPGRDGQAGGQAGHRTHGARRLARAHGPVPRRGLWQGHHVVSEPDHRSRQQRRADRRRRPGQPRRGLRAPPLMSKPTIVTMPGDGIGKTVLGQARRVLSAVGFEASYVEAEIGWEAWAKGNGALPDRTVEVLTEHQVGLLGALAVGPRRKRLAALDAKQGSAGTGEYGEYRCPRVELHRRLDLQLSIRPCRTLAGNPLNFIRRTTDEAFEEPAIDVVVVAPGTAGLHSGVEWTDPPAEVRKALESHEHMAAFAEVPSEELAIACRICGKQACHDVCEQAFAYAERHGYSSVTLCDMPLAGRATADMLEQAARQVGADHGEIALRILDVDAQLMWLTRNPEDYRVILTGAAPGDIIADAFAGLVGGPGFTSTANLGERCAIFEPNHRSHPTLASLEPGRANPIAMILAACLMLDHLDQREQAGQIRTAIAQVVEEGSVRTQDMLKLRGRPEELSQETATCIEMTDAIIDRLWPGAA